MIPEVALSEVWFRLRMLDLGLDSSLIADFLLFHEGVESVERRESVCFFVYYALEVHVHADMGILVLDEILLVEWNLFLHFRISEVRQRLRWSQFLQRQYTN